MKLLAIDPGNEQSAYVLYDGINIEQFGILPNTLLRGYLDKTACSQIQADHLAIEMIASYGMAVGKSVFETCVWIGRFIECWGENHSFVYRKDVKMYLCGSMKAKDANIRQAVMDRYGSTREKAIGTKKSPGALYGVSKDVWAALAIAITYTNTKVLE